MKAKIRKTGEIVNIAEYAKIKSYTDLEQSKKLTEFLPIVSADMRYAPFGDTHPWVWEGELLEKDSVPCWSLAALLSLIKDKCGYFEFVYLKRTSDDRGNPLEDVYRLSTDVYDVYEKEEIDACYEMIIKLHEQNLL